MTVSTLARRLCAAGWLSLSALVAHAQLPATVAAHQERGSLVLEGIPAPDAALADRLQHYASVRSATLFDWLPDGSLLVGTRFGASMQVHRVAAPLGMREQLTFGANPVRAALAPATAEARGFVFLEGRADAGAELNYYDLASRNVRALTSAPARHAHPVWSRDGERLAYSGADRDGVSDDIYVVDIAAATGPRLVVAATQNGWSPLDWSVDGRQLLLQSLSSAQSALYLADVASGALTPLDAGGRKSGIRAARFTPDGRGVYVLSDEGGEFAGLRRIDLVTHQSSEVAPGIPWDIDAFDASADGHYLAYVANEDGVSRLTVLDVQRKLELAPVGLPERGLVTALKFDRTGRRLALAAESAQTASDVYVYDLEHGALARWTRSEPGPLDPASFVAAQLVHFPTWDRSGSARRMLSAYVYEPRSPGPHPVLIDMHGGPDAQYRPSFDAFTQFLVNELGYAVVSPNVRGSAGYGKSFLTLDDGLLRTDAVRDIGALLVWLGMQSQFDRERTIVAGDGDGGWLALASLAAYPERLQAGIDLAGITDFVSFLGHASAERRELTRAEYGDERDAHVREFLERISPLRNPKAIRRPLLVVHGLNDPRVPASESAQLVARLRLNGNDVWYLVSKDAGEAVRSPANPSAWWQATTAQFLARWGRTPGETANQKTADDAPLNDAAPIDKPSALSREAPSGSSQTP